MNIVRTPVRTPPYGAGQVDKSSLFVVSGVSNLVWESPPSWQFEVLLTSLTSHTHKDKRRSESHLLVGGWKSSDFSNLARTEGQTSIWESPPCWRLEVLLTPLTSHTQKDKCRSESHLLVGSWKSYWLLQPRTHRRTDVDLGVTSLLVVGSLTDSSNLAHTEGQMSILESPPCW